MRRILAFALVVLATVSCGADPAERSQILVSAAASLTDAFAAIEAEFEAAHPEFDVVINLSGSSALREQILAGAPVDVFASANLVNMGRVEQAGFVVGDASIFAINQLSIAVPLDNSAGVVGLEDFGNEALLIGLCAESVPCGDFARTVLSNAGVVPAPDTVEPDVRALLTKIEAGELDAGIVYTSDIAARAAVVSGIGIADELNLTAEYPIAVLSEGDNSAGGAEFVSFVISAPGQAILSEFGFATP